MSKSRLTRYAPSHPGEVADFRGTLDDGKQAQVVATADDVKLRVGMTCGLITTYMSRREAREIGHALITCAEEAERQALAAQA